MRPWCSTWLPRVWRTWDSASPWWTMTGEGPRQGGARHCGVWLSTSPTFPVITSPIPSIGHNEVIGVCRVGPEAADPHGREHWAEMLANPRKPVEHWHQLVEVSEAASAMPGHCEPGGPQLPVLTARGRGKSLHLYPVSRTWTAAWDLQPW